MADTHAERTYHHGNLRRALLQAAERRLCAGGADSLTLRDLARDTGVSHGAPRRHFADRQALLDALAVTGFERLGGELRMAVQGVGEGFVDRLRAVAAAYVHFAIRNSALLELMFAGKHGNGPPVVQSAADDGFVVLLEVIHQGQKVGFFEAKDPERVALVLFATVHGFATLVVAGMVPPGQLDDLFGEVIEQFLCRPRPGAGDRREVPH
jgi:AcrR family transcriptional regulator